MTGPLWNTIRSFWTPETSRDPELLRLVRVDKALFAVSAIALLIAAAGGVMAVAFFVSTLTGAA